MQAIRLYTLLLVLFGCSNITGQDTLGYVRLSDISIVNPLSNDTLLIESLTYSGALSLLGTPTTVQRIEEGPDDEHFYDVYYDSCFLHICDVGVNCSFALGFHSDFLRLVFYTAFGISVGDSVTSMVSIFPTGEIIESAADNEGVLFIPLLSIDDQQRFRKSDGGVHFVYDLSTGLVKRILITSGE